MAAVSDRLSRAIPFNPLKPFDRYRFADLIPPRCSAAEIAFEYVLPVRTSNCFPERVESLIILQHLGDYSFSVSRISLFAGQTP
jgi:hypothetical protein